jgi:SPOR domain
MADSSSRSSRARDPLAELARLIGQGDASGDLSRDAHQPARTRAPAARDAAWIPENRFPLEDEGRYAAPRPSAMAPAPRQAQDRAYQDRGFQDPGFQDHDYQSDGDPKGQSYHDDQGYQNGQSYQNGQGYQDARRSYQDDPRGYPDDPQGYQHQGYQLPAQTYQDQGYQDQGDQDGGYEPPAGSRFFSGQAAQFNGFRDEPDQGLTPYPEEGPPHLPAARGLATYPSSQDGHGYGSHQQHDAEDEASLGEHDDYQEPRRPRRRTGVVAIMAVFALMIVGTAGAFGYRAMFGGSVLPTLPPIIKATGVPNKIALDSQSGANAAPATTGSTENLVSREEQPVAIDPGRPGPRVVSTVPISPDGQSAAPPGMSGLPPANQVATAGAAWPAPPPTVAPAPPPQPETASGGPKKIHTVTIRSDQTGTVPDGAANAAPAAAARAQARANAAPKTTASIPAGGAAPMSIVPGQGGDAAPAAAPRTRTAAVSPAAGGGSYVQVTSRRSEGEAQTEFRTQQAKFPSQLNGREPVIRRADLGEKGVYFRALVGPFASAEEAAQLCSGLKAAGGNCIVQK